MRFTFAFCELNNFAFITANFHAKIFEACDYFNAFYVFTNLQLIVIIDYFANFLIDLKTIVVEFVGSFDDLIGIFFCFTEY